MSNPIFFVDGQTEQNLVRELCQGSPVQRTALNGNSVTIQAIAKKLSVLIRLRGGRNHPIVILIDREQRKESFRDIAASLRNYLEREGLKNEDIRIGVADRMFENWILGDPASLPNCKIAEGACDGIHGTAALRKSIGKYNKSTDGVRLFRSADHAKIYANSASYRHFVDQLTDLGCYFLQDVQAESDASVLPM